MRPAHRAAAGFLQDLVEGDIEPVLLEHRDDPPVAVGPGRLQPAEAILQGSGPVRQEVHEQVHGGLAHLARQLAARDQPDADVVGRRLGLGQALDGVVIGEGDGRQPRPRRHRHHLGRGIRPVRGGGVAMQIDQPSHSSVVVGGRLWPRWPGWRARSRRPRWPGS